MSKITFCCLKKNILIKKKTTIIKGVYNKYEDCSLTGSPINTSFLT